MLNPSELERVEEEAECERCRGRHAWVESALRDYERLAAWLRANGVAEWEDTVAAVLELADARR
jgi:hypothetical protein